MLMSLMHSVIFLSLATAELFPSTTKSCSRDESCESEETCEWVRNKYQQVIAAANDRIKQTIVNQLKAAVCNKAKKAFCCPRDDADITKNYPPVISKRVFLLGTRTDDFNNTNRPNKTFPANSKSCREGETCETKETCEWVKNKFQQVKTASNSRNIEAILTELKAAICNKAAKAFCCPRPRDNTDGTYLPTPDQCGGSKDEFGLRVVGGEDTNPGDFPFAALLGYPEHCKKRTEIVRCIKYLCGGTLINRRYVLTAAHCARAGKRKQGIREVVLGEWDVNMNPDCQRQHQKGKCITKPLPAIQKFQISSSVVTIHPDFGRREDNHVINDIALIRLPRLADLNAGTRPVCLPIGGAALSNLGIPNLSTGLLSTSPTVVGWGYTTYDPFDEDYQEGFGQGNGNVATSKPKKLSHGLLDNTECHQNSLLDSQICGDLRRGQGACPGDSGSGLYLNGSWLEGGPPWYQVGIVSFGSIFCDAGKPVIYTRISSFVSWIKQNLKP